MNENNFTMSENIWYLIYDENTKTTMAQKRTNGTTIIVPATTEILKTIKKQMEANIVSKKIFEKISLDNDNIIAYIYLLLDQYINFLESDNLECLISMMKKLENDARVDANNASFINRLRISYTEKDNDTFYDVLDEFENYNIEDFSKFYEINKNNIKAH